MARYLVISNETNSIVTVIDWDGVTPLFENMENAPNYRYELETDFSYTYELNFTSSSDIMTLEPVYAGKFNGFFDGIITPNTVINGRPIYQIPKDTEYGRIYYQGTTNDFFDKLDSDTQLSSSFFAFDNEVNTSEIYLTLTNNDDFKIHNYSSSLSRILTDNLSNFVFKLKSDIDTSFMEYLISSAELDSSLSGKKYVKLLASKKSEYINNDFKRNSAVDYDLLLGTDWNIDFDFGDKTQVGKFIGEHTGSFTGSFEGYAELTGSFFGAFKGLLDGTASNSVYALTASFTQNASSIEVIEKSKNWIKPSWAKTIRVTCVGGGGGGGAAPASEESGPTTGGGGGGGGTITVGEFDADTLPDVITITVGAGGIGGIHDGTNVINASNGGNTYFGNYLIARGGNYGWTGVTELNYIYGGSTIANIDYLNTGAGGGGAGTINGEIVGISNASMAPPIPLPEEYLAFRYYITLPTPIPAVIAPTGGGGGLGYDESNGGRQGGITDGGSILPYALVTGPNLQSLSPYPYSSGSNDYYFFGSYHDTGAYPAFNTTVGLGGRGGNPFLIDLDLSSAVPTEGTIYGGGGGGAYGGGIVGRYAISGDLNGTPYNFGANGARGVVVIISEA